MPPRHTLTEAEAATRARIGELPVDLAAADAVLSLYRAANSARSYLTNNVLRAHDLTWTGFLVLWILWLWRRLETREVADTVGISKATLTGVTNTLVRRGLVQRLASVKDGRLVELELTPAGEALLQRMYPEFNAAERALLSGLGEDQVAQLTDSLRRVVTTADEAAD